MQILGLRTSKKKLKKRKLDTGGKEVGIASSKAYGREQTGASEEEQGLDGGGGER